MSLYICVLLVQDVTVSTHKLAKLSS